MKVDKEKWLDGVMNNMEDDMKRNRQGDFFKKMKKLTRNKVRPGKNMLDETGKLLHNSDEKVSRWKRHFDRKLCQKKCFKILWITLQQRYLK